MKTIKGKEDKKLILEASKLGQCYMKLKDLQNNYPEFKPKEVYEMIDDKTGKPTRVFYVNCEEVKLWVVEDLWKKIATEIYYDWYQLHRDSDIRLVKTKVPESSFESHSESTSESHTDPDGTAHSSASSSATTTKICDKKGCGEHIIVKDKKIIKSKTSSDDSKTELETSKTETEKDL